MYVYIQTETRGKDGATHDLWTVGFFDPDGKWHSESDHSDRQDAATRVAWLNGGGHDVIACAVYQGDPTTHIVPADDLRQHDLSPDCWCRPTPDDEHPSVYAHHSMDRREEYEEGRKLS